MPNPDLTKLVDKVGDQIESIIKSKNGWLTKLGQLVEVVIPEVEVIGETWKGKEKKELAMTLINDLYFKYLQSNKIPDWLESIFVKRVASFTIDKFVALLNSKGIFTHRSA